MKPSVRAPAILVLVGAILGSLGLYLLSTLGDGPSPDAGFGAGAGDDAASADLELDAEAAREAETRPRRNDDSRLASTTTPIALRVRVVRGDTRQPCAGAYVAALPMLECLELEEQPEHASLDRPTITERFGTRIQAGPEGIASIPARLLPRRRRAQSSIAIAAWSRDRFGFEVITMRSFEEKTPFDIALEDDKSFVLRVLGPTGKPMPRYPVVFYRVDPERGARFDARYKADDTGRLVLPHWQIRSGAKGRWAVLPDVLYRNPPILSFTGEAAMPEYELRVGETGKLSFELEARGGLPAQDHGAVVISCDRPAVTIDRHKLATQSNARELEGGRATFERVGLGLNFQLRVDIGRLYMSTRSVPYRGPVRPAQHVTHKILLDDGIRVSGKIKLAQPGELETSQRLSVTVTAPNTRNRGQWVRCSADGSFSTLLPFCGSGSYRIALETSSKGAELEALRQFQVGSGGSSHELGDVLLERAPVLVRGLVLDTEGHAVKGASVSLRERRRVAGREQWSNTHVLTTQSAEDGRFELRGHEMQGHFRLVATSLGYAKGSRPLRLGESAVTLRLARLGSLILNVVLPPDFLPRIALHARPVGSESSRAAATVLPSSGKAQLLMRGMTPGEYKLTLESTRWPRVLWSQPRFVMKSGEVRVPEPIDLTQVLERFRFVARDADGAQIDGGVAVHLRLRDQYGKIQEESLELEADGLEVIAPAARVQWRAHLEGHPPIRGEASPGETVLRIPKRGRVCRFDVSGLERHLRGAKEVHARLALRRKRASPSAKEDEFAQRYEARVCDLRDGRATVTLEFPDDEYEVVLLLTREAGTRASSSQKPRRIQTSLGSILPRRLDPREAHSLGNDAALAKAFAQLASR